jgi:hypothetical protein
MTPAELRAYIEAQPEFAAFIASGNDQGICDAINLRTVPVIGSVTAHDIRQYLMLVDLLLPIEDGASPACRAATRALDVFPVFDMSNPLIAGKFTQVLDGLVADALVPDFTETHKLTILSFATTEQPLAGRVLSNIDIARAFGRG